MGKQEGQRKIAAINLKSLLGIFSAELDKIVKPDQPVGPKPSPLDVAMQPDVGDEPMIEPALPSD